MTEVALAAAKSTRDVPRTYWLWLSGTTLSLVGTQVLAFICASTTAEFLSNLETTPDEFNATNEVLLDRRAFVAAYCQEKIPDFDAAAKQFCADAIDIVGRSCPGEFSTVNQ